MAVTAWLSRALALWLVSLCLVAPVFAQQQGPLSTGQITSPILTIDSDRLYRDSAFGKRVAAELERATAELAAENRRIEAELEAEEQAITERRPNLSPEEFRVLADAFDERVQTIRDEREARSRELTERLDEDRRRFLNAAAPVLETLMRDAGAAVILERRSVFLSANAIDVTDEAIERLDATLGDGGVSSD